MKNNVNVFANLKLVFRTINIILKRGKFRFFFVSILRIVVSVTSFVQLVVFSNVINTIVQGLSVGEPISIFSLYKPLLLILILFLVPSVCEVIREYFNTKIREDLNTDLEVLRAERFSNLDIATVESSEFQAKLQRASDWGVSAIRNMYGFYEIFISTISALIFAGVLLLKIDYRLAILAIFSVIPGYIIDNTFGLNLFKLRYMNTDNRRIAMNRFAFFTNSKSLIDVIQNKFAFRFIKEGKDRLESNSKDLISLQKKKNIVEVFSSVFVAICSILAIYLAVQSTVLGLITIGALLIAYNSYSSFRSSIQGFFENIGIVKESSRYARDWYELMDMDPQIIEITNPVHIDKNEVPFIEFKNVSFAYPGQKENTLENLSFVIQSKTKLAIVGENGAGKTTLIRLITRVYDPTEGDILIDGINLRQLSISEWRDMISVLLQDFITYNLTAKESIALGRPDEEVVESDLDRAASLSGAMDFIDTFSKGYDQLIWKGFQDGVELSRGQHQRIAVARTIYRNSPILIFDEPTSAIDAVAEEKIFNAIENEMKDKTVILISHRFSTVKNAENIIFLEHGKIIEQGPHQDLMIKNGRYAELYNMQASRYLENE